MAKIPYETKLAVMRASLDESNFKYPVRFWRGDTLNLTATVTVVFNSGGVTFKDRAEMEAFLAAKFGEAKERV